MTHDIARYVRRLTSTLRMTCHAKKNLQIFMQIQNNAKGVKPGIKMLTQMDNVEASESQNVATCKPYHLNCLMGSKEKKNVLLVINSYFFFKAGTVMC